MAKFIKAPVSDDETVAAPAGPVEQAAMWIETQGLGTGLPGAVLLGFGAVLLLIGAWLSVSAVRRNLISPDRDGEVVSTEPAEGTGFTPVVAYRDAGGRQRRFLADIVTQDDPTGLRVLVRVRGGRPFVVAPGGGLAAEGGRALLALALGALAVSAGLTGAVAGVVPVPGL